MQDRAAWSMRGAVLAAMLAAAAIAASRASAQNFNTCRVESSAPYATAVAAQRGRECLIELRQLGIASAQIMTAPVNGRAEIRGAVPLLAYQSSPTFIGADRVVVRVSGPNLRTGLWTFRVLVR